MKASGRLRRIRFELALGSGRERGGFLLASDSSLAAVSGFAERRTL
jgi:hypothetical protein